MMHKNNVANISVLNQRRATIFFFFFLHRVIAGVGGYVYGYGQHFSSAVQNENNFLESHGGEYVYFHYYAEIYQWENCAFNHSKNVIPWHI